MTKSFGHEQDWILKSSPAICEWINVVLRDMVDIENRVICGQLSLVSTKS
jgi:hypothetical protein